MHPASRSLAGRWIYAAKLDSWPKLLVPALLGQALGASARGCVDLHALVLGMGFTLATLLFVVFLNDYGDRRVDRIKRQMFPDDCSPKTIPDEILPAAALLRAGVGFGLLALGLAVHAELALDRAQLSWVAAGCLALFWAYSFGPVKLNYRGGGEWLEGLGVGLALPCLQMYWQGGVVWARELWLLPAFALMALASAVASGLSDEQSDRRGGKRTYVSEYGNRGARSLIERLVLGAALLWALCMRIAAVLPIPFGALAVVIVLVNWRRMRQISPEAKTNAFAQQRFYKRFLHQAQWRSASLIALSLFVAAALGWRL